MKYTFPNLIKSNYNPVLKLIIEFDFFFSKIMFAHSTSSLRGILMVEWSGTHVFFSSKTPLDHTSKTNNTPF